MDAFDLEFEDIEEPEMPEEPLAAGGNDQPVRSVGGAPAGN